MAGLNEDAQWIVLMGFVVSFSLFFLAMLLNQSTVVGQTTAEGVLDFPKNDIRDVKTVITEAEFLNASGKISPEQAGVLQGDIEALSLSRKNAIVAYTVAPSAAADAQVHIEIHYNNGVTEYNEFWTSP